MERLIEKITSGIKKLKSKMGKVGKTAAPIALATTITVGSVFGFVGCDNQKQEVVNNNHAEAIADMQEVINSMQKELDALKEEVNTKAEIKEVELIKGELLDVVTSISDLTSSLSELNSIVANNKMDADNKFVQQETFNAEITEKYKQQQIAIDGILEQLTVFGEEIKTLSNTDELKTQVNQAINSVNRLSLENTINLTFNTKYNEISSDYSEKAGGYHYLFTAPNGDAIGKNYSLNSAVAIVGGIVFETQDGKNTMDVRPVANNSISMIYSLFGKDESIDLTHCSIEKTSDGYIAKHKEGEVYVTVKNGYISNISNGDINLEIKSTSKNDFDIEKLDVPAYVVYSDLEEIVNNSWNGECIKYIAKEENETCNYYMYEKEGYYYAEEEGEKVYSLCENNVIKVAMEDNNGEIVLDEATGGSVVEMLKKAILYYNGKVDISFKDDVYTFTTEYGETVKYIVENNKLKEVNVSADNVEFGVIEIISEAEYNRNKIEIVEGYERIKQEKEQQEISGFNK